MSTAVAEQTLSATASTAYQFAPDDITALSTALAHAYLISKTAAYRKSAKTAHATTATKWLPSDEDTVKAQALADEAAQGIAETYSKMLQNLLSRLLEEEEEQTKAWGDLASSILDRVSTVIQGIKEWFAELMGWKPEQIADMTVGLGADDGMDVFVEDVLDGTIEDVTANLGVAVVPSMSSGDYCAEFAGNIYSLEDGLSLPVFPMHNSCIHSTELVNLDEMF